MLSSADCLFSVLQSWIATQAAWGVHQSRKRLVVVCAGDYKTGAQLNQQDVKLMRVQNTSATNKVAPTFFPDPYTQSCFVDITS